MLVGCGFVACSVCLSLVLDKTHQLETAALAQDLYPLTYQVWVTLPEAQGPAGEAPVLLHHNKAIVKEEIFVTVIQSN